MGSAAAGQEQGKVPVDELPGGGLHFPGKPPLHGAGKALGIEAAKKEKKKQNREKSAGGGVTMKSEQAYEIGSYAFSFALRRIFC